MVNGMRSSMGIGKAIAALGLVALVGCTSYEERRERRAVAEIVDANPLKGVAGYLAQKEKYGNALGEDYATHANTIDRIIETCQETRSTATMQVAAVDFETKGEPLAAFAAYAILGDQPAMQRIALARFTAGEYDGWERESRMRFLLEASGVTLGPEHYIARGDVWRAKGESLKSESFIRKENARAADGYFIDAYKMYEKANSAERMRAIGDDLLSVGNTEWALIAFTNAKDPEGIRQVSVRTVAEGKLTTAAEAYRALGDAQRARQLAEQWFVETPFLDDHTLGTFAIAPTVPLWKQRGDYQFTRAREECGKPRREQREGCSGVLYLALDAYAKAGAQQDIQRVTLAMLDADRKEER